MQVEQKRIQCHRQHSFQALQGPDSSIWNLVVSCSVFVPDDNRQPYASPIRHIRATLWLANQPHSSQDDDVESKSAQ
jgi:hypothetical protein